MYKLFNLILHFSSPTFTIDSFITSNNNEMIYFSIDNNQICFFSNCFSMRLLMIYSMIILYSLHLIWFYSIVKLILKTLSNKTNIENDPREKED